MPRASIGDLELHYEAFGQPDGLPLLLIAGLGSQLTLFRDEFCQGFADRGFLVIRYDHRDVGLSTRMVDLPIDQDALLTSLEAGRDFEPPYTLSDMAADGIGLLQALGIDRAHVFGVSMGGMVAQLMAIEHPDRVLSLTSVMSTTGSPDVGQPTGEAILALLEATETEQEAYIEQSLRHRAIWTSPGHFDEEALRDWFVSNYERAHYPEGGTRHLAAVLTAPARDAALASVTIPALVIHGTEDTLVAPDGGEATADALANAELLLLEGMSHDLPSPFWAPVIEAVTRLAAQVADEAA